MKAEIFFNTDGFLGGFGTPTYLKEVHSQPITMNHIRIARKTETGLVVDMTDYEFGLFARSILARDHIEILPTDSPKYDVKFGNLTLKFNDIQDKGREKIAKEMTELTESNMMGNKTKDCEMFQELYT